MKEMKYNLAIFNFLYLTKTLLCLLLPSKQLSRSAKLLQFTRPWHWVSSVTLIARPHKDFMANNPFVCMITRVARASFKFFQFIFNSCMVRINSHLWYFWYFFNAHDDWYCDELDKAGASCVLFEGNLEVAEKATAAHHPPTGHPLCFLSKLQVYLHFARVLQRADTNPPTVTLTYKVAY